MNNEARISLLLGLVVVAVIGIAIIKSPSRRAAAYGVEDKDRGVLVVKNTSPFPLVGVSVTEGPNSQNLATTDYEVLQRVRHRGVAPDRVYSLPPGPYHAVISYRHEIDRGISTRVASGVSETDFKLRAREAVIITLRGGDPKHSQEKFRRPGLDVEQGLSLLTMVAWIIGGFAALIISMFSIGAILDSVEKRKLKPSSPFS